MVSLDSIDVIDFVRVHSDVSGTCNMTDPELIMEGALPTGGQTKSIFVVGASVRIVGSIVGPLFVLLVGENVG